MQRPPWLSQRPPFTPAEQIGVGRGTAGGHLKDFIERFNRMWEDRLKQEAEAGKVKDAQP